MYVIDIDGDGDDDVVMARTLSMEIKMLDGPICENVFQILDMTAPKPRF